MSRSQKQRRRPTASVQRKPAPNGEGKGNGVVKRTGTERPEAATEAGSSKNIARK